MVTLEHLLFGEAATATLTARVQGSSDRANFLSLDATPTTYTIQIVATGAGAVAGASKSWTLPVDGWRWLRAMYTFTSNAVESSVSAFLSAELNVD